MINRAVPPELHNFTPDFDGLMDEYGVTEDDLESMPDTLWEELCLAMADEDLDVVEDAIDKLKVMKEDGTLDLEVQWDKPPTEKHPNESKNGGINLLKKLFG